MILNLNQATLELIAKVAGDVQRSVYYEQHRQQAKPGEIGAVLERREFYLMAAVIRELWKLGWRPPGPPTVDDVRKPTKRKR